MESSGSRTPATPRGAGPELLPDPIISHQHLAPTPARCSLRSMRLTPTVVATLCALQALSCSTYGTQTGTVSGQVVNTTAAVPLEGVTASLTMTTSSFTGQATTNSAGYYSVIGVPPGSGFIALSGLPSNCTPVDPAPFVLTTDHPNTLHTDFEVTCPVGAPPPK